MLLNGTVLPDGYSVYGHQVAGHRFETGKQGMLLDCDSKLLKPIQAPPRGERELEFYQTVFGCETSDPTVLKLRHFVPTFYGVKHVVLPGLPLKVQANNYIILEDLTRNFDKPCILDIKVGRRITDHLATQAKQERAIRKYPEQEQFGFRILGMKLFDKPCKRFTFYDKSFGKKLKTHTDLLAGLEEFVQPGVHGKGHIRDILEHLKTIKIWALEQRIFRLYSSSVLLIYEGNEIHNTDCLVKENADDTRTPENSSKHNAMLNVDSLAKENKESGIRGSDNIHINTEFLGQKNLCVDSDCSEHIGKKSQKPKVSIHLVDFAHTYIGHYDKPDENYLYGLCNLIQYFEQMV